MTNNERSTVVGLFQTREDAQCAVEGLKRLGLDENNIGFAMRDSENTITDTTTTDRSTADAGEGAVGGAVAGGLLGAVLGAAAALLIPGVGPIVAGGILASALGGAAIGAAAGGLLGALTSMGVPEEEARYYDQEFQSGRIVVTARADRYYDRATQIMRECGAYNVNAEGMTGMPGYDRGTVQDTETLRLREEELAIHKDRVQTGEVVVRKNVVTESKTVEVPVTREEVTLERRPVNEPVRGDIDDEGKEIRVPITEEQVSVEKRPVVREEVRVNKRAVQDTEHVSGQVRREEVDIEEAGDVNVRDDVRKKR